MMKLKKRSLRFCLGAGIFCLTAFVPGAQLLTANAEVYLQEEIEGTFRPSDMVIPREEVYEFPYIGLTATLPESLLERMDRKEVAMLSAEEAAADGSAYRYAWLSWNTMTEEQKNAEVPLTGDGYQEWADGLERIGTLGIYQTDLEEQLDELTGCTEHQKLGQSSDGAYVYYLSVNPDAEQKLAGEIREIKTEIGDMLPFQATSAFDLPLSTDPVFGTGEFTTQDIYGNTYTQELFQDYELTMVNVFTTWCSPCVAEIPELQELSQEMADQGVQVVGIVMDAVDEDGNPDAEVIEKARLLAERTGAAYPFLLPDSSGLNGRLNNVQAFPETFFVDKNGNIVGETYMGSDDLAGWKDAVETELARLTEAE